MTMKYRRGKRAPEVRKLIARVYSIIKYRNVIALALLGTLSLAASGSRAQDTKASPPPNTSTTPGPAAANASEGTQVRNATSGVMQDRSSKSPEAALYVEKCSMCHRQMGMGTVILARRVEPSAAMLEARTDLTESFVIQAVRAGIGNMPRIARGDLSDAQLETIARYLAKGKK